MHEYESPLISHDSATCLVILRPEQIVTAPPEERARTPIKTAWQRTLLYAVLKLAPNGMVTSFLPLPGWTWSGPGECACCGTYIREMQRCGQCGSTARLARPGVPFSQRPLVQRPRLLSSIVSLVMRAMR